MSGSEDDWMLPGSDDDEYVGMSTSTSKRPKRKTVAKASYVDLAWDEEDTPPKRAKITQEQPQKEKEQDEQLIASAQPALPPYDPFANPIDFSCDGDDVTLIGDLAEAERTTTMINTLKRQNRDFLRLYNPKAELEAHKIRPEHFYCILNGPPGSGKSTALIQLVHDLSDGFDNILLITTAMNTIERLRGHIPPQSSILVVDDDEDIDEEEIQRELEQDGISQIRMTWTQTEEYLHGLLQKLRKRADRANKSNGKIKPFRTLLIFDDIAFDSTQANCKSMLKLGSNFRHHDVGVINVTQIINQISPKIRAIATHVMTFFVSGEDRQKSLRKDYFTCVPAKSFTKLLRKASMPPPYDPQQRSCLVIDLLAERQGATYMECCYYFRPNNDIPKYTWTFGRPWLQRVAHAVRLTPARLQRKKELEAQKQQEEARAAEAAERAAREEKEKAMRVQSEAKVLKTVEKRLQKEVALEHELPSIVGEVLKSTLG